MHADTGDADGSDGSSGGDAPPPPPSLATVPLDGTHKVGEFICPRSARVQSFLHSDCRKLIEHNYCRVFVWPDPADPGRVLGYYSLSAALVQRSDLSTQLQKKVPGGIPAPVVLLGFMGKTDGAERGFGSVLMYDAALRVSKIEDIGIWGIALDAETDGLVTWYGKLGFTAVKWKEGDPEKKKRFMYARVDTLLGKGPA